MSLQEQIAEDMKAALRSGEKEKLGALRLLRAALQSAEKEARKPLAEGEVAAVVNREIKRRQEAIEAFQSAGRGELVAKEQAELEVLRAYQPQQLGEDQIRALARAVIAEVGATSPKQLGAVMRALMPRVQGRADGRMVNALVRQLLENGA